MAVTADKYSANTLNDKDTVSGQTITKNIYTYIPLALKDYKQNPNNNSEPVATSDASFCEKFFCHDVWKFKDSQGKDCVIGLLNPSQAAANPYYNELHRGCSLDPTTAAAEATGSRKGKLRKMKGGVEYIVPNDGGLNTKPFIDFTNTAGILCTLDYVILYVTYQNAYYLNSRTPRITIVAKRSGTQVHSFTQVLDVPTVAKTKSASYAVIVNPVWNQVVQAGDSVEISLSITNDEGTYTPSTLTGLSVSAERIKVIELYKIDGAQDPLNCNPIEVGIPYRALLFKSWYDSTISHDDPKYPNLATMFDTTVYGPNVTCYTKVQMTGIQAQTLSGDILTDYLPDGIYWGVPDKWDDPEEADPQGTECAVYISDDYSLSGEVIKYNYVTIPQPAVVPQIDNFVVAVGNDSQWSSYAYIDQNNYCHVVLYPKISVTGKGLISFSDMEVTLFNRSSSEVFEQQTFDGLVNMGSSISTVTPVCTSPGDPQGENEVPYIELAPFYWYGATYTGVLRISLDITSADISVTPTASTLSAYIDLDDILQVTS